MRNRKTLLQSNQGGDVDFDRLREDDEVVMWSVDLETFFSCDAKELYLKLKEIYEDA